MAGCNIANPHRRYGLPWRVLLFPMSRAVAPRHHLRDDVAAVPLTVESNLRPTARWAKG